MKHLLLIFLSAFAAQVAFAQITDPKATEVWDPAPKVIEPANGSAAPSDAIILFNGKNLSEWVSHKNNTIDAPWTVNADGSMTVKPGTGDIETKKSFGDCQLHLEFKAPEEVKGEGQGRGNSGVFLQNRYEVQVLDCFRNKTYSNGQTGSIYKQSMPLVNACLAPGQWQTYDILYTAPRFNRDGILTAPGRITVLHNGIVIQLNTEIKGTTEYIGLPKVSAHDKAPIRLQDHGDLVSYRNIWIREL
ncbi:MAG: DUF1080 domain-containing protein [Saprospiraceae bacterium]|nr:DUF1080 domain-containing protein [Saprospiraceae bacterium]